MIEGNSDMTQQSTQPAPNPKRQLTFLKTINQKLEGMRRENERLLRIADNPRVAFSRSSLAGLYRIVNSLVSAGPMYGLRDIEEWAKENREWLVSLGKRGAGPAPEEMERLQKSIGELSRLRDEAVSSAEKNLKSSKNSKTAAKPAETPIPSIDPEAVTEESPSQPEVGDETENAAAPSTSESDKNVESPGGAGFPFADEPKAQSINESTFAPKLTSTQKRKKTQTPPPKNQSRRFRDRTSTIPLAIDDLAMLGTTSKIPPNTTAQKGVNRLWRIAALVSAVGFVLMTILYIRELARPEAPPAAVADVSKPAEVPTPPAAKPSDGTAGTATSAAPTETAPAASAPPTSESDKIEKADKKTESTEKSSKKSKRKDRKRSKSSSSKSSSKSSSSEPKGILRVKAPADGSSVFVLVDGTSRGKAPVKTVLSPGLHEVVFTANGKRSMRMIPIKADNTKTVVAVKPN